MRKYLLVKGKRGRLVPDPFKPQGFVGQRQLYFEEGNAPKARGEHFEPTVVVVPKHRHLAKALKKGSLEVLEEFTAKNTKEALKKLPAGPAAPPPPPVNNDDDDTGDDE